MQLSRCRLWSLQSHLHDRCPALATSRCTHPAISRACYQSCQQTLMGCGGGAAGSTCTSLASRGGRCTTSGRTCWCRRRTRTTRTCCPPSPWGPEKWMVRHPPWTRYRKWGARAVPCNTPHRRRPVIPLERAHPAATAHSSIRGCLTNEARLSVPQTKPESVQLLLWVSSNAVSTCPVPAPPGMHSWTLPASGARCAGAIQIAPCDAQLCAQRHEGPFSCRARAIVAAHLVQGRGDSRLCALTGYRSTSGLRHPSMIREPHCPTDRGGGCCGGLCLNRWSAS